MGIKNKETLTVGFTYNVMPKSCSEEQREHYIKYGEWDSPETIESVTKALENAGSRVIPLESYKDDKYDIYNILDKHRNELDVVFNIAEGFGTKNRESIIPAMMEWLHIPFTGSDASALSTTLNKATTIEILQNYGILIAPYFVFEDADIPDIKRYITKLEKIFPLIVKPIGEGTSVGMSQESVVDNMNQLKTSIERIIHEYNQPAMVQQFLDGEEYTVGILGDLILPILKINLEKMPNNPKIRDTEVKEIDINYSKPARFDESYVWLAAQAAVAHTALSCRDYNRMDFRKHKNGNIYFLEANPLPGLNPASSDFPKIGKLAGLPYDIMINAVLYEAIKRYQNDKEFACRFQQEMVEHIRGFIQDTMNSLESYHITVSSENTRNITPTPYRLIKVKK